MDLEPIGLESIRPAINLVEYTMDRAQRIAHLIAGADVSLDEAVECKELTQQLTSDYAKYIARLQNGLSCLEEAETVCHDFAETAETICAKQLEIMSSYYINISLELH